MQVFVGWRSWLPDVQFGIGPGYKRGFLKCGRLAFAYKIR